VTVEEAAAVAITEDDEAEVTAEADLQEETGEVGKGKEKETGIEAGVGAEKEMGVEARAEKEKEKGMAQGARVEKEKGKGKEAQKRIIETKKGKIAKREQEVAA